MTTVQESMVCPSCGRRTYNPHDVDYGWCGSCKTFTRGGLITGSVPMQRWCAAMCGATVPADNERGVCAGCRTGVPAYAAPSVQTRLDRPAPPGCWLLALVLLFLGCWACVIALVVVAEALISKMSG